MFSTPVKSGESFLWSFYLKILQKASAKYNAAAANEEAKENLMALDDERKICYEVAANFLKRIDEKIALFSAQQKSSLRKEVLTTINEYHKQEKAFFQPVLVMPESQKGREAAHITKLASDVKRWKQLLEKFNPYPKPRKSNISKGLKN